MTILAGSLALRFEVSWRTLALELFPMPVAVGIALCLLPMPPLIEAGQVRIRARELSHSFFRSKSRNGGRCLHSGGTHWVLSLADHPRGGGGSLPAWRSDNVRSVGCAGKFRRHFHALADGGGG
jgi:hypothetical protein